MITVASASGRRYVRTKPRSRTIRILNNERENKKIKLNISIGIILYDDKGVSGKRRKFAS